MHKGAPCTLGYDAQPLRRLTALLDAQLEPVVDEHCILEATGQQLHEINATFQQHHPAQHDQLQLGQLLTGWMVKAAMHAAPS